MAGILMPNAMPNPQAPPPVPTVDNADVQTQAKNDMKRRAMAQGRASTLLTDPSTQREADPDQMRKALG